MLYSERQKYNFLSQSLDTPSAVLHALRNLRERKKRSHVLHYHKLVSYV